MPRDETVPRTADGQAPTPSRKRARASRARSVALFAMPSALMLSLSSPLAQAEPLPDNPFQDGPCVEMPDAAEEPAAQDAEEADGQDGQDEPAEAEERDEEDQPDQPEAEESGTAGAPRERTAEPEPEPEPEPAPAQPPAGDAATPDPDPAEEPAAERERHPLDPLGVGDALRDIGQGVWDLLTPKEREAAVAEPEPEPEPEKEPEKQPEPEKEPTPEQAEAGPESSGRQQADAGSGTEPPAGSATVDEPAAPDAGNERETGTETETGTGTDGAEADPFAPDADGKVPFPCPEQKQVAGVTEQTPYVVPDEPWYLDASYLTLRGLKYHGVVNITTDNGTVKQVLKFTADRLDIGDLHQIVDGTDGLRYHVQAADGSNSTFRNGKVTMYTERLEGKLFGLIPITFDPQHEPPLDIPIAHFTDVWVTQAAQFGGTLTMPGMRQYTTRR